MDLFKLLMSNGDAASQIAGKLGLNADDVSNVIGKLAPALSQGVQRNVQEGGLDGLANALQKGNHQKYMDDPSSLSSDEAIQDGNGILGHILGSKDASRNLAAAVGSESGIGSDAIKKMLPMVAAMAMGALSKQTNGGEQLKGGAGDLLSGLLGGGDAGGMLGNLAKKLF